jgi:small-conductance mechanosensitive channel
MIGLVTAGLTVVMKDFIVDFFRMVYANGKNGMSVGDWVEIEGVSGEVTWLALTPCRRAMTDAPGCSVSSTT